MAARFARLVFDRPVNDFSCQVACFLQQRPVREAEVFRLLTTHSAWAAELALVASRFKDRLQTCKEFDEKLPQLTAKFQELHDQAVDAMAEHKKAKELLKKKTSKVVND
jgi:hypothetical protein